MDIPNDAYLLNPGARQQYSDEWQQGSPNSGLWRVIGAMIGVIVFVGVFLAYLTDRFYILPGQDNSGVIVGTLMLVGTGLLFVVTTGLVLVRQREQVLGNETMLTGKIVDFRSATAGGEYTIKLVYTFVSPKTGYEIRNVLVDTREDLRDTPPPASGTPVVILYRSDEDYRLL